MYLRDIYSFKGISVKKLKEILKSFQDEHFVVVSKSKDLDIVKIDSKAIDERFGRIDLGKERGEKYD